MSEGEDRGEDLGNSVSGDGQGKRCDALRELEPRERLSPRKGKKGESKPVGMVEDSCPMLPVLTQANLFGVPLLAR